MSSAGICLRRCERNKLKAVKVLQTVASLRPSYGGPARSVPALAEVLRQCGCETTVWAADGSGEGDGSPAGFDLVHDHGIWLPYNWRLSRTSRDRGIPRLVSPRGMLEPWAMRHKRWKKRAAWWLYQRRDLAAAACLHATSESEAHNFRRLFPRVPVCTIPNGVELPANPAREVAPDPGKPRTALFLGRIYPVKGLPMLVEAWNSVRPTGWRMEIAGPDEAGHRREVEAAIRKARLEDVVVFSGPLDDAGKREAFARAELFILPSYSENFGMAIAEALAHGVPVLTTTGTPWAILKEKECGWWVNPTAADIAPALGQATSFDSAALQRMGRNGRAVVAAQFTWEAAAEAMMSVYRWLLGGGPQPACVSNAGDPAVG